VRAVRAGLEGGAHVTLYAYDSYDRRVLETDPMGNVAEYRYDANGNPGGELSPGVPHAFGVRIQGELVDVPGSAGNVRLAQATYAYDSMDRGIVDSVEHFDPATQAPIGDGQRLGTVEWSDIQLTGRLTADRKDALQWYMDMSKGSDDYRRFGAVLQWHQVQSHQETPETIERYWQRQMEWPGLLEAEDDHGHTIDCTYDTANRLHVVTDAKGNTSTSGYDENGNVLSMSSRSSRSTSPTSAAPTGSSPRPTPTTTSTG
jgi:YD repeat-containing protein